VTFALDWITSPNADQTSPIIIIITGIAGQTTNHYVRYFAKYCISDKNKYRVAVFNWPGCGDVDLTSPYLDIYGDISCIHTIMEHMAEQHPNVKIHLVGFSLGGNLTLRYLAQVGSDAKVTSAVTLAAGYDLKLGIEALGNSLYMSIITNKWKKILAKHEWLYKPENEINFEEVLKSKTLQELDSKFTLKVTKSVDLDEFYKAHSSNMLSNIKVPCLMLNSKDDPVVPRKDLKYPIDEAYENPYLFAVVTNYGGHMAWATGILQTSGKTWMDTVALEFIQATQYI